MTEVNHGKLYVDSDSDTWQKDIRLTEVEYGKIYLDKKHTYFILLLTSSYSCFYHWLCNARSADFFAYFRAL